MVPPLVPVKGSVTGVVVVVVAGTVVVTGSVVATATVVVVVLAALVATVVVVVPLPPPVFTVVVVVGATVVVVVGATVVVVASVVVVDGTVEVVVDGTVEVVVDGTVEVVVDGTVEVVVEGTVDVVVDVEVVVVDVDVVVVVVGGGVGPPLGRSLWKLPFTEPAYTKPYSAPLLNVKSPSGAKKLIAGAALSSVMQPVVLGESAHSASVGTALSTSWTWLTLTESSGPPADTRLGKLMIVLARRASTVAESYWAPPS
jgi:hypothetical protein